MRVTDLRMLVIGAGVLAFVSFGFINAWQARSETEAIVATLARDAQAAKHAQAQVRSPRIILAGGSNVMLGLDAGIISRQLHRRVVNVAMPGALGGSRNYDDWLMSVIRPGDIVLFSDSLWTVGFEPTKRDIAERRIATLLRPALGISFAAADRLSVWIMLPETSLAKKAFDALLGHSRGPRPETLSISQRAAEDRWEAVDGRWTKTSICVRAPGAPIPQPSAPSTEYAAPAIRAAATTAARIRRRGAHIIFAIPMTLIRDEDRAIWADHFSHLRKALGASGPVLNLSFDDVMRTDADLFCDGPTHLLAAGRRARSLANAAALQYYLNEQAGSANDATSLAEKPAPTALAKQVRRPSI